MRPHVLFAAALFAVALAAGRPGRAADDDKKPDDTKYAVKAPKVLAKGDSVKFDDKTAVKAKSTISDDNGNSMNVNKQLTFMRVYVEKTLEADEKANKRTKFSRKYEKASDLDGDEATKKPYNGRTIVFEKDGDTWKVSSEGDPVLGEDDLKDLTEEVNKGEKSSDALYPTKEVKVGEKWTVKGKDVASFLETLKMDPDTVKAEGKLVKVYKKGDKQWGTIEYDVTFEGEVQILKKVKSELKITLDHPLDGTPIGKANYKLKQAAKQTIDFNCMKINVDATIELGLQREATEAK